MGRLCEPADCDSGGEGSESRGPESPLELGPLATPPSQKGSWWGEVLPSLPIRQEGNGEGGLSQKVLVSAVTEHFKPKLHFADTMLEGTKANQSGHGLVWSGQSLRVEQFERFHFRFGRSGLRQVFFKHVNLGVNNRG